MMDEEECHRVARKICSDFLVSSIEYLDMPITILQCNIEKRNPDWKLTFIKNQKKIKKQLDIIVKDLKKIKKSFD
jgi:hypothetical protein